MMHLYEEPERFRQWNRRVPRALEEVVLKALAKEPGDRPTAAELSRVLADFATE